MHETMSNTFLMIGGFGMLVYGLWLLREGLLQGAGGRMKSFLAICTGKPLRSFVSGTSAAAILQSSSVVTVMVVEFVETGLMNLSQASGLIMGANVGTCITAWLICLESAGGVLGYLRPSLYAPVLTGIGAVLSTFTKKHKSRIIGQIILGGSFLFIGIDLIRGGASVYAELPFFHDLFLFCAKKPLPGILLGTLAAALLQSSSLVLGMLQLFTGIAGNVTMASAVYISLGANLGTCVTSMVAGIGHTPAAKQASLLHLFNNAFGAIVIGGAAALFFALNPALGHRMVSGFWIAGFHTIYNFVVAVILLPLTPFLIKLAEQVKKR